VKKNERLIYENGGKKLEISYFSPYLPTSFSESLGNEITTAKNNLQDGESFLSSSLGNRTISIEGVFQLNQYNVLERQLRKVFNPRSSGVLTFSDGQIERHIDVRLESLPTIKRQPGMAQFYIDLVAHNPFWSDAERAEELAVLLPMAHFPLVIPKTGFVFGVKRAAKNIVVDNIGDVSAGFRIIFRAKGGVKNPYLETENGQKIKLACELAANDLVEIQNEPYVKSILLNGKKDFSILNRAVTDWFVLEPGENHIGYGADENAGALDVAIYYKPQYLGV